MWIFRSLSFAFFFISAHGQNFGVPSDWRIPTSTPPRNVREGLSQAAVNSLVPLFNTTSGQIDALEFTQGASLLCAISLSDLISGNTSYNAVVVNNLNTTVNSDRAFYGLAAIDSYRAYNDSGSLSLAEGIWDQIIPYQITAQDAASGSHPARSVDIPSECDDTSIVGGVFYLLSNPENTDVNGETIGAFLALSAYLYEATNDDKYATAAELAAQFIQLHLYNGTIILDTFTVANCFVNADLAVTYNSGFVIEGLSVLASKNSTWSPFLLNLISSTVPFPAWTNASDGVIIEGSQSDATTNGFGVALKSIFVRGLYEAWSRTIPNSPAALLIQSYLTVQFNALTTLASIAGSNVYSSEWEGPPVQNSVPWGQLAALDVLNSAVGIAPKPATDNSTSAIPGPSHTSTTSSSGTPTPTNTFAADESNSKHAPRTPIVVGIVIGCVVLVAIVLLVVFIIRRRRKQGHEDYVRAQMEETAVPFNVNPYRPEMSQTTGTVQSSSYAYQSSSESRATFSPTSDSKSRSDFPSIYSGSESNPSHANAVAGPSNAVHDTNGTASDSQLSPIPPRADTRSNDDPETDLAAVPRLIDQLNQILSRLPQGGVDEEQPPQYES